VTRVRFHPEARAELRAAVQFYETQARGLGRDLALQVRAVVDRLADLPASGSPAEGEVRRAILMRFPFSVVYRVSDEGIQVVAVMHQRQQPGYWRSRT
jgi:plasmid stabilization system protein ParE